MDESFMWQFAEKYGGFSLDFGSIDPETHLWKDLNVHAPDCMPWTLHFTKESGETADWDHHFAGFNLPDLFQWAADFIDDKVDDNGFLVE